MSEMLKYIKQPVEYGIDSKVGIYIPTLYLRIAASLRQHWDFGPITLLRHILLFKKQLN
jgi:hypothetical protein